MQDDSCQGLNKPQHDGPYSEYSYSTIYFKYTASNDIVRYSSLSLSLFFSVYIYISIYVCIHMYVYCEAMPGGGGLAPGA